MSCALLVAEMGHWNYRDVLVFIVQCDVSVVGEMVRSRREDHTFVLVAPLEKREDVQVLV